MVDFFGKWEQYTYNPDKMILSPPLDKHICMVQHNSLHSSNQGNKKLKDKKRKDEFLRKQDRKKGGQVFFVQSTKK